VLGSHSASWVPSLCILPQFYEASQKSRSGKYARLKPFGVNSGWKIC
jgi:hypothetical protein